jgi:hypothetical protein
MSKRIIAAAFGAAVLAVPTAAVADPGHGAGHGHGPSKESVSAKHEVGATHQRTAKAKKVRRVTFVFKGRFTAPGTVAVVSGNHHVRKGGFVGQTVTFDLAGARIVAADTNADAKVDVSDVQDGDMVLVQARLPRRSTFATGADPIMARNLIDRTHAAEPGDDSAS